jgi:alkylation response protein AidB-like acyl-CoA dehydrogenase
MSNDIDIGDAHLFQMTTRNALTELFPSARVRELMATQSGWDPPTWCRLAGELGVAGLMVDERFGGSGLTARELGLVFEEAGRCLGGSPMFAVAGLAIPLLLQTGDAAACEKWLPGLCDGSLIATVMYADADGRWGPSRVGVHADDEDRLSGRSGYVIDAAQSDVIFAPAHTPDGLAVFAIESHAAGVEVTPLITLDQTRKQARVELTGAQGVRLDGGAAAPALDRAYAISCALLACELSGVAARCLDMTVEYARERVQFGRPIGSFQAVKQKLADLLIQVESARSAATAAVAAAADDSPDLWWTASLAKAYCSEAAMHASEETIQIHGGIGFTWEHDAHLYFKRARSGEELLGTAREHYGRVAEHVSKI